MSQKPITKRDFSHMIISRGSARSILNRSGWLSSLEMESFVGISHNLNIDNDILECGSVLYSLTKAMVFLQCDVPFSFIATLKLASDSFRS